MRAAVVGGCVLGVRGADKVLLTRHCARSFYTSLRGRGDPDFDNINNYTALPLPTNEELHVKGNAECTPRGLQLAEVFGQSLSEHLSWPISVLASNQNRHVDTAKQIALGLGEGASYDGQCSCIVEPTTCGLCPPISYKTMALGVQSMLDDVEAGLGPFATAWAQRHEVMNKLQEIVGLGEAPSIADIPSKISDRGAYVGGLQVASQAMIENYILEAGAGVPVAWGAFDGERREELWKTFMPLNILYGAINHRGLPLATREGPVIMSIFQKLRDATTGTDIVVASDTNLDAVATLLNLTWSCGPYPDNAAPPHTGLLFERDASLSRVTVRSVCTSFDDDDEAGKVIFGTVAKASLDMSGQVAIEDLEAEANQNLDKYDGRDCRPRTGETVV